ncbi:unnamed protein product, partial [Phaeothamnion confervicola]
MEGAPPAELARHQLLPRHRAMAARLDAALGINDMKTTELLILTGNVLGVINQFVGAAHPTIYFSTKPDEVEDELSGFARTKARRKGVPGNHLRATLEPPDATEAGSGVIFYFTKMKVAEAGDGMCTPIDPYEADDGALACGLVADPVATLGAVVGRCLLPALKAQDDTAWGAAPPAWIHEFHVAAEDFAHTLQNVAVETETGPHLRLPGNNDG